MRETGMPVHLATTSATSSASTSSLSMRCCRLELRQLRRSPPRAPSRAGAACRSAARPPCRGRPCASPASTSKRAFSICSLSRADLLDRLPSPAASAPSCRPRSAPRRSASSFSILARRSLRGLVLLLLEGLRARSRAARSSAPPRRSRWAGESISMRRRLAASSMRSMALSGRKRSAM